MSKLFDSGGRLSSLDAICAKLKINARKIEDSSSMFQSFFPTPAENEIYVTNTENNSHGSEGGSEVMLSEDGVSRPPAEDIAGRSVVMDYSAVRTSSVGQGRADNLSTEVMPLDVFKDIISESFESAELEGRRADTASAAPVVGDPEANHADVVGGRHLLSSPFFVNESKDELGGGRRKSRRKNSRPQCIHGGGDVNLVERGGYETKISVDSWMDREEKTVDKLDSYAEDKEKEVVLVELQESRVDSERDASEYDDVGGCSSALDLRLTNTEDRSVLDGLCGEDFVDDGRVLDLSRHRHRQDESKPSPSVRNGFQLDARQPIITPVTHCWVTSTNRTSPVATSAAARVPFAESICQPPFERRGRTLMTGGGQVKVERDNGGNAASPLTGTTTAMGDLLGVYGLNPSGRSSPATCISGTSVPGSGQRCSGSPSSLATMFGRESSFVAADHRGLGIVGTSRMSRDEHRLFDATMRRGSHQHVIDSAADDDDDEGAFGGEADEEMEEDDMMSKVSTDSMSSSTSAVVAAAAAASSVLGRGHVSASKGGVKRTYDDLDSPSSSAKISKVLDDGKSNGPLRQLPILSYTQFVAQNIQRFESFLDCSVSHCRDKEYKEHFHCTACSVQVSFKKDKLVRHYKWHKKRDDSLQQGFLRFSPLEDCFKKFGSPCTHNNRNTHYHCIQDGCNKVYISTSDVQMHANFHRKDTAIIQEGFQRFRATENCNSAFCLFADQKTTHFHCRRFGCSFTFKNKSDMEKHKMYHQKDEMLARDGFKKFMKYESCNYDACPYSHISNHIHCIRSGCNYVLHSSGQLLSHKRKHERRAIEQRGTLNRFRSIQPKDKSTSVSISPSVAASTPHVSHVVRAAAAAGSLSSFTSAGNYGTLPLASAEHHHVAGFLGTGGSPPLVQQRIVKAIVKTGDIKPAEVGSMSVTSETNVKADPGTPSTKNSSADVLQQFAATDVCVTPFESSPEVAHRNSITKEFDLAPISNVLKACTEQAPTGVSMMMQYPVRQSSPTIAVAKSENETSIVDSRSGTQALTTGACYVSPFVVPKSLPRNAERRERDDSWKTYLTRYTANDVCNVRCQLLYKDHYHCLQPLCGTLFRSKDGIRDHARLHEHQDRITETAFTVCSESSPCSIVDCESTQQLHYHCNSDGCDAVVLSTDSVFARLEHHRSHDSHPSSGTSSRRWSLDGFGNMGKRRGRPPKYDAIKDIVVDDLDMPTVQRLELTDQEVIARAAIDGPSSPMAFGFIRYLAGGPCPDARCPSRQQNHYHCARRRCNFVESSGIDALEAHCRNFHAHVRIDEGYEFFDSAVDCRRPKCHARRGGPGPSGIRHYHCVRPRCDYAFVRLSTMAQHSRKHRMESSASTLRPERDVHCGATSHGPRCLLPKPVAGSELPSQPPLAAIAHMNSLIQQANLFSTSSPLFIAPASTSMIGGIQPMLSVPSLTQPSLLVAGLPGFSYSSSPMFIQSMLQPSQLNASGLQMLSGIPQILVPGPIPTPSTSVNGSSVPVSCTTESSIRPLSSLLLTTSTSSSAAPDEAPQEHYVADENCGRPFCKLKKRDHYHCARCGLAFSDVARLRVHLARSCSSVGSNSGSANGSTLAETKLRPDVATKNAVSTSLRAEVDHPEAVKRLADDDRESMRSDGKAFVDCDDDDEEENSIRDESVANGIEGGSGKEPIPSHDGELSDDDGEVTIIDLSAPTKPRGDRTPDDGNNSTSVIINTDTSGFVEKHQKRKQTTMMYNNNNNNVNNNNNNVDEHPLGYDRYRCSEDCQHERCTYRFAVTHYHCRRSDCGYSFCDRTRFASHADRHRRVDVIAGDLFAQCNAKGTCSWNPSGEIGAVCALTVTHYHCRLCVSFVCGDATKMAAHRKRHTRLNRLAIGGFRQFGVGEDCGDAACLSSRSGRGALHCHCSWPGCGQVVFGPAQMAVHRAMHGGSSTDAKTGSAAPSRAAMTALVQPLTYLGGGLPTVFPATPTGWPGLTE